MPPSYARKAEGVATISTAIGESHIKTATCGHCNSLIFTQTESSNVCHVCWSLVCDQCHAKASCTPWEEQMRRIEARAAFLRSAGIE